MFLPRRLTVLLWGPAGVAIEVQLNFLRRICCGTSNAQKRVRCGGGVPLAAELRQRRVVPLPHHFSDSERGLNVSVELKGYDSAVVTTVLLSFCTLAFLRVHSTRSGGGGHHGDGDAVAYSINKIDESEAHREGLLICCSAIIFIIINNSTPMRARRRRKCRRVRVE